MFSENPNATLGNEEGQEESGFGCSSIAFGNQTIFRSKLERFTALRLYLAAGLPLSCAIGFCVKRSSC